MSKQITERAALDLIRATATRSVPNCINLQAIDRILADVPPVPSLLVGSDPAADIDASAQVAQLLASAERNIFYYIAPAAWRALTPNGKADLLAGIATLKMLPPAASGVSTPGGEAEHE